VERDDDAMDRQTIQELIKDIGLPCRLVEVRGRLIIIDMLDDRNECFERCELGVSAFCDLLLDWRQRMIDRSRLHGRVSATIPAEPATTSKALPLPHSAI
jgi:hypothetical protein